MSAATATGEWLVRGIVGQTGGGGGGGGGGGFSHDSEHDLALMVCDFLENGGSSGADSLCSSDSDSGLSDLHILAEKISFYKRSIPQHENDLLSMIHSLIQSMKDADLFPVKSGTCNASCIRFSLTKLLRLSCHDAAVCVSRWQGSGKIPGGDHEYIDVIHYKNAGSSERLIIDIDFQSHFEIARAVHSYDRILKSLPVIFVGSLIRLKQYLQVMVEAAKSSLKQNSMPLPPWRSLAYLQAKWHSPYQRHLGPDKKNLGSINSSDHIQCSGHLKRLQLLIQSETEEERLLKTINIDTNRRMKLDKRRHSLLRGL